jgi:hypothetical protein
VRAAALRAAREVVLGVLEELAFHLAAVVGRWCERLTGREVETAGRSGAFGPSPHGAPPPPPATPRRAPKRTAAEVEEELPEVQSQEQAADSRVERLAGRAEGRRVAAEKAKEAVGSRADPRHVAAWLDSAAAATRQGLGGKRWEAVEARRAEQARAGGEVPLRCRRRRRRRCAATEGQEGRRLGCRRGSSSVMASAVALTRGAGQRSRRGARRRWGRAGCCRHACGRRRRRNGGCGSERRI